ncbi:hypothetical protein AVEN_145136-1 [Araneus ventricosus]|uniref:Uncharacterized protein n=1 Tax=Araneus ventricosus TaxID=182803 RepID=A0A4Y2GQJ2_ARAVE|nr:hypothetical protein AVEN_145136-1 [Araneus ventricosus]
MTTSIGSLIAALGLNGQDIYKLVRQLAKLSSGWAFLVKQARSYRDCPFGHCNRLEDQQRNAGHIFQLGEIHFIEGLDSAVIRCHFDCGQGDNDGAHKSCMDLELCLRQIWLN